LEGKENKTEEKKKEKRRRDQTTRRTRLRIRGYWPLGLSKKFPVKEIKAKARRALRNHRNDHRNGVKIVVEGKGGGKTGLTSLSLDCY